MIPEWQQRMLDEYEELDGRITKIYEFYNTDTFRNMSFLERELLWQQLEAMEKYRKFLGYRLDLYKLKH